VSFRHADYFTAYGSRSKASKYDVSNTRATVNLLLEQGAFWRPDNVDQVAQVRRALYECEPDVTLELVERLLKQTACTQDTIHELLRTAAMKKHLIPVARKLALLGFDVRTAEHKAEDKRQQEVARKYALRYLVSRYNREKIVGTDPAVAKRYNLSDVGLAKVCRKLNIPRPGRGYWAMKAAGKTTPRRPPLPELST
jgi:hypothetical protein